jgi:hypothetical protein
MSEKELKQEQGDGSVETPQETTDAAEGAPTEAPSEEQHDRLKDATENIKETTEKLWGNTRQAWTSATFKASQYKRLVQKKIDLSAIHKKIGVAHGDLGKLIDELRDEGKKNILNLSEVKQLFQQLDSLKASAAALEEEIENIKEAEHPPQRSETPPE